MTSAQTEGRVPQFDIWDRLRKARESAELEQAELAARLEVSRNTISRYEAGKATPKRVMISAWALATGVSVEWLRTGWAPRGSNPQPTD